MIVLICGGRDYTDGERVFTELARLHNGADGPVRAVIEGGARGADLLGRFAAMRLHILVTTVEADWKLHGRSAGPIRNQKQLDLLLSAPDKKICLAFPTLQSRGTWDMVRRCRAVRDRIETIVITPEER